MNSLFGYPVHYVDTPAWPKEIRFGPPLIEPAPVQPCNDRGIVLDRCPRFLSGVCVRCGKKKRA